MVTGGVEGVGPAAGPATCASMAARLPTAAACLRFLSPGAVVVAVVTMVVVAIGGGGGSGGLSCVRIWATSAAD